MKKSLTTFPETIGLLDEMVEITMPQPLGLTAQIYIHEVARKLPLFVQEIDCDAVGQDKEGNKIAVNTVGRWLFGVPGYAGHSRIALSGDKISIYFPKESPKVVHELVLLLKKAVETSK
jgi:hypothetical protein